MSARAGKCVGTLHIGGRRCHHPHQAGTPPKAIGYCLHFSCHEDSSKPWGLWSPGQLPPLIRSAHVNETVFQSKGDCLQSTESGIFCPSNTCWHVCDPQCLSGSRYHLCSGLLQAGVGGFEWDSVTKAVKVICHLPTPAPCLLYFHQ